MAFKFNMNNVTGNILRGRSVKSSILSGLASSGLSGIMRSLAVGLLGGMTRAQVILTNLDTGEKFIFALTPDKISAKSGARFQSYNVIENGEVKYPRGEKLTSVSWSGTLPGDRKTAYEFVDSSVWQSPDEAIALLENWRTTGNKLRIVVTQTSINLDVYIENFSYEWAGGQGDATYSLDLVAAKDMLVKTVEEVDAEKAAAAAETTPPLNPRASKSLPSTITMKAGGNPWTVAQGCFGQGGKWTDIMKVNPLQKVEDIAAGTVLKLPH